MDNMKNNLNLEKIASDVAGLGVAGLVLVIAISATGLAGAAALTAALAALGPGGMIGGIATLGVIAIVVKGIAEFGVDAILEAVTKELLRQGETHSGMKEKISKYPISKNMKCRLYAVVDAS